MEKRSTQSDRPSSPSSKAFGAMRAPLASSAKSIHSGVKRSQTLVRRATKKPVITKSALPPKGRAMDIAKSPNVSRFNKFSRPQHQAQKTSDVKRPFAHPVMDKLNLTKKPPVAKPTMQETKEQQIKEAIAKVPLSATKEPKAKKSKKFYRLLYGSIAVVTIVVGVWALYTYVPAVSIRIAASQAGINATYPSFTPEGYSFVGPIVYKDNKVYIKYSAQGGGNVYEITEEKSSWDSSAVKENIASNWANHSPSSFEEQGQNVYYSIAGSQTRAAWVNGGVLYQLTANTGLTWEHLSRIVKSM